MNTHQPCSEYHHYLVIWNFYPQHMFFQKRIVGHGLLNAFRVNNRIINLMSSYNAKPDVRNNVLESWCVAKRGGIACIKHYYVTSFCVILLLPSLNILLGLMDLMYIKIQGKFRTLEIP